MPRKEERMKKLFSLLTALALCLSLAACGAKQYPMENTVVNRTTYPIADIRISLTSEEDCGVFTYSMDEVSTYYADSTMYDGVSYRVFEVDEDSLVWGDEGVYYLME